MEATRKRAGIVVAALALAACGSGPSAADAGGTAGDAATGARDAGGGPDAAAADASASAPDAEQPDAAVAADAGGTADAGPIPGYFVSGAWHGYAWTKAEGEGTTISPKDFADVVVPPACAKGVVPVTRDYSGLAYVGFNLNQASAAGSPVQDYKPTGTSIAYDLTMKGAPPPRLFLQAGQDGLGGTWCVDLKDLKGSVPLSSFSTQCWGGGTGQLYGGEALTAVAVAVVQGGAPVSYDLCVAALGEQ